MANEKHIPLEDLEIYRLGRKLSNDYWLELLKERGKIKEDSYKKFKELSEQSSKKLQNFINSIYKAKNSIS